MVPVVIVVGCRQALYRTIHGAFLVMVVGQLTLGSFLL